MLFRSYVLPVVMFIRGVWAQVIVLYAVVLCYDMMESLVMRLIWCVHSVLCPLSLGSHLLGTINNYVFGSESQPVTGVSSSGFCPCFLSLFHPSFSTSFLPVSSFTSRIFTVVSESFKDFKYSLDTLETSLFLLLVTSMVLNMIQILLWVKRWHLATPAPVVSVFYSAVSVFYSMLMWDGGTVASSVSL